MNIATINLYTDVNDPHWKLRHFSNLNIRLTDEIMEFLQLVEGETLLVTHNTSGTGSPTITIKKF